MKQKKTIEQLKDIFPKVKGLHVALLYGSFGRNDANANSDIDIKLLVDENFSSKDFLDYLKIEFKDTLQYLSEIKLRKKIIVYFKSHPKVEFGICYDVKDIDRNYLGSEITKPENTILYTNEYWNDKIIPYLLQISKNYSESKTAQNKESQISDLIDKFICEFENCSNMHRRSDAFQFYFFYNIALHLTIQLHHLSKGQNKYNFLPKSFTANTLKSEERDSFYELNGSLFLPEANQKKRKLLEFFYASINTLISNEKKVELKTFCEWVYERDYFWNFRDISKNNPRIKSGLIYRTATLTLFQGDSRFDKLLRENNIKTVIDLRADREIKEHPYTDKSKAKFNYVRTPFDPWNQPQWYKEKYQYGTNEEIAYRFFGMGCKEKIKLGIETILNEKSNSISIQCFAGKDRTGIFVTLLHLLVDTPLNIIHADYLASEVDVQIHRLEIVLEIISDNGGIVPYLVSCGLSQGQIDNLKDKLLHGN